MLGDRAAPNYLRSVCVSVGYMLIAVEEQGLSTVTYTLPDPEKVRETLRVPETLSVETAMPLGYSADDKPKEPRRALSELVYRNTMS